MTTALPISAMPKRIQRKRSRGWKMPKGAVYVGRPSKWGNPFVVDEQAAVTNRTLAVQMFRKRLLATGPWSQLWITVDQVRTELRGKDLACWCPLVDKDGNRVPCHADVLLEIANS